MKKTVLISGASAGIGKACAELFAEAGYRLILLARRKEVLENLASELNAKYTAACLIINADIRNADTVKKEIENLPEEWKQIDVLINNSGKAKGLDKIHEGKLEHWEEMIDTNIKGLLYLSRLVMPGMVSRGDGLIINIGSIAGREAYPSGNIYCSTKAAVKMLSKAMALDLNGTGVKVCNLDPGLVETEFASVRFDGNMEKASNVYKGYKPLEARDIAEVALFVASRPPHVMIQDILITPRDQANATTVFKQL